ncbi:hypothetical protein IIB79_09175 [candidate division KSB1 bacterium]|nr:hypothetical protein [candidate division KSB1 bacterium]
MNTIMSRTNHSAVVSGFLKLLAPAISVILLLSFASAQAQDFEETLQSLSEIAAKSYVKPVVDGFASNMNGGWYHKAPSAKIFGIDFEFGVVAMGTFIPDEDRFFSTSGLFRFNREQAAELASGVTNQIVKDMVIDEIISQDFTVGFSGPTIIGSGDENVKIDFAGGTFAYDTIRQRTIELAGVTGLFNEAEIIPFAAPQLSIGTVLGTQVTFRYVPKVEINDEIGELNYFGFGIQHNPMIWIGGFFPVDVSIGYFTQTLEVGDFLEATATAYGINASKQFGGRLLNIIPYVGVMFESSEIDFRYEFDIDTPTGTSTQTVAFNAKGVNETRFTVGLSFKLAAFNINADYNVGEVNSVTAGFMIGF